MTQTIDYEVAKEEFLRRFVEAFADKGIAYADRIGKAAGDAYDVAMAVETNAFTWYQRLELSRAREKHGEIPSIHAAESIIREEMEEFAVEVRKKPVARDVPKMVQELTQIAAMCQRTFEDLKLNERYRPQ